MPEAPLDIVARDLRFDLAERPDPAWFDGDPLKTAIMDGFAVMLPEGERFFIRSLRHYLDRITDPAIRQDIQGYAVQEAYHTREHEAYNAALRRLGHDVDEMERRTRAGLARARTPFTRLLVTCAIEQVTYAFARFNLARPDLFAQANPAYRRLWIWHALEELEHSAVSLRVLRAVTPGMPRWKRYIARVTVLNWVLLMMTRDAARNIRALAVRAGVRGRWRSWRHALWLLFGRPGFVRGALLPLLAFYIPGYDATRPADAELVRRGRAALAAELAAA